MKLKIVLYPDPILGKVCSPVPEITDEIRTLARDMLETMYEAPGVGLAAPQVGKLLKKGGIFLCSGIIDDRADEVREKLVEAGWTIEETRSSEGWFSYLCR